MFTEGQKKAILEAYREELKEPNNLLVEEICRELRHSEVITFYVEFRESSSTSWLQAEAYIDKIGMTVILDYEISDTYEDAERFLLELEDIESKLDKFNRFLR